MDINVMSKISEIVDNTENKPVIKKIVLKKENKILRKIKNNRKKIIILLICLIAAYFLMLIPIFYLYPQYNKPVKLNYKKEWFTEISSELKGDCFRKVQDFRRRCPFPTREVHLSSKHTLVEIKINRKWIAYDPSVDLFFSNLNAAQISFDVNRGFYMDELENYSYKDDFKRIYFYHNYYFILLKHTHPYYDKIIRLYYGVKN
jgi:hypothetical protein